MLDKPSRMDSSNLLSGTAGEWFKETCLKGVDITSCEITTLGANKQINFLHKNVQKLLVLGPESIKYLIPNNTPGYVQVSPYFPTAKALGLWSPQDACDHRNIEHVEDDDDNEDAISDEQTKDDYPTRRPNYRFWMQWHIQKLLKNENKRVANISPILCPPDLRSFSQTLALLKGENLYLDIETSRRNKSISCIGLSWDSAFPKVYTIPIYNCNSAPIYADTSQFIRALFLALKKNTPVIHNAMFDLIVLCGFYNFPLPESCYDTMVANHRLFPEAEKSLAHLIAQWTNLPYHKNTSTETFNHAQDQAMWLYNAKDVYALKLIRDAQLSYASKSQTSAINQGNGCLVPYLESSLTGLKINRAEWQRTETALQRRTVQLRRICAALSGISDFNPGSAKQCVDFFHNKLNFPVISRSEIGAPQMGRKQLYQLMLKSPNPLIPAIIAYRKVAKDCAMLGANLWSRTYENPQT